MLCLGDEKRGEDTSQHKKSKNLHAKQKFEFNVGAERNPRCSHVFHEFVRASDVNKLSKADLRNDSSELSRGSRYAVACRTVTSGESLSRNNESGGVGTEVLEEVGQAVQEDESVLARGAGIHGIISESCQIIVSPWIYKKPRQCTDP